MKKNKATGSDKIPIEFYQSCWKIIKEDVMQILMIFISIEWTSVGSIMESLHFYQK
jgi:hypothetical protein